MKDDNKKYGSLIAMLIGGLIGRAAGKALFEKRPAVDPEVAKILDYIDEKLLEGQNESALTAYLVADAMKYFGRELTPKELDIIRMRVITEKVKLREEGRLKD